MTLKSITRELTVLIVILIGLSLWFVLAFLTKLVGISDLLVKVCETSPLHAVGIFVYSAILTLAWFVLTQRLLKLGEKAGFLNLQVPAEANALDHSHNTAVYTTGPVILLIGCLWGILALLMMGTILAVNSSLYIVC